MSDLAVTARLVIPAVELHERFSRSSGPGGQSVNTTDSRVELSWDIDTSTVLDSWLRERLHQRLANRLVDSTLTVVSSEYRSQLRNREAARARLAGLIRAGIAAPPPSRRPTRPSRSARAKRVDSKKARGAIKRNRGKPTRDD